MLRITALILCGLLQCARNSADAWISSVEACLARGEACDGRGKSMTQISSLYASAPPQKDFGDKGQQIDTEVVRHTASQVHNTVAVGGASMIQMSSSYTGSQKWASPRSFHSDVLDILHTKVAHKEVRWVPGLQPRENQSQHLLSVKPVRNGDHQFLSVKELKTLWRSSHHAFQTQDCVEKSEANRTWQHDALFSVVQDAAKWVLSFGAVRAPWQSFLKLLFWPKLHAESAEHGNDESPQYKGSFIFAAITSHVRAYDRRMLLRRTWMQHDDVKSGRILARFFVARNPDYSQKDVSRVNEEVSVHKDVFFYDESYLFLYKKVDRDTISSNASIDNGNGYKYVNNHKLDDYTHLIEKTLVMLQACANSGAPFCLKIDDDTFPRFDRLYNGLVAWQKNQSNQSKWIYAGNTYNGYKSGCAYVLSADLARQISNGSVYDRADETRRVLSNNAEDMIVGWQVSEVQRQHIHEVDWMDFRSWDHCECTNEFVFHYSVKSPSVFSCLWNASLKVADMSAGICDACPCA